MGKKRKTIPSCPAASTIEESQGLYGVSEESRRTIFNAACRALSQPDEQVDRTKWNAIAREMSPDIFVPVSVEGVDGDPLTFYVAQVKRLLQHIVSTCKEYALLIETCLQQNPGMKFDLVLYNDEAQGGNLLAPVSGKKASLWYFCIQQLGWRWCDQVWHPLCLVPHNDFEKAAGGFSAISVKIFRSIMEEELHTGIPVSLPSGNTLLTCDLKWVISDLDSIRGALSLKGSAAIRCCFLCANVVKKNAGLEQFSDLFHDIASSNIDSFHEQTDADIFQLWDYLLNQQRILTKKAMEKKEKSSGFNVCDKAMLSDRVVREILPPSSFLLDTMHVYWSNGIVSWEVNAVYSMWTKTNNGNIDDFFSLNWRTASKPSNTKSWRRSLCHQSMFSGVSYKGSASNLQSFFPLFLHFLEGCLGHDDTFTAALKSMRVLRRITVELRNLAREDVDPLNYLQSLQVEHHQLTQAAFGYDHIKPKHHARFHIPKQAARAGFHVDCFPGEKKHKIYKSHIGLHRYDPWNNSKEGQFGHIVMRQIWTHHIESLKKFSFSSSLTGNPQVNATLAPLLGRSTVNVSAGMVYKGRNICAGDVLLGEHPGIVLDVLQAGSVFFVRLEVLHRERHEEFISFWKKTSRQKLVPVSEAGRCPMWWLEQENDIIRCIH